MKVMKDLDYIKIFTNSEKNEVMIFNRTSSSALRVHKDVYDLIKNIHSTDDIDVIGKDFNENDQQYFNSLSKAFKELHILDDFRSNDILRISLVITDNCNLHCKHCCYSANYQTTEELTHQKPFDMKILRSIIQYEPKEIGITGGEPLTVPNFIEVLDYLDNNYKGTISLSTNATLITKDNVERLCKTFSLFDISIDGVTVEKADSIRGKGTFDKVINSVKLLKENNAKKISLSIVLTDNTKDDRQPFINMCHNLGVEPLVRHMSLVGRAKENNLVGSDNISDFTDVTSSNIACCYDCPGGVVEFTVNSLGDVFPCNNFIDDKYKIGNILKDNIHERLGWNIRQKWFKEYSRFISDTRSECQDCIVNTFCWNCPSIIKTFIDNNGIDTLSNICRNKKKKIWDEMWND